MRQILKWPGFALVAIGIIVFPLAIWFPGPWGVISLVMIMLGCFMLVFARPTSSDVGDSDEPSPSVDTEKGPDKAA